MSDWQTRSFWLGQKRYRPRPSLEGDRAADIVIVGGGYTGLWSAIMLKDADPSLDIVLLEKKVTGYGASGRNGGFGMTMVTRNIHDLLRKVGLEQARATHLAMVESLKEIKAFAEAEGIDADISDPGILTVSNGMDQDVRIHQDLEAAERLDLEDFHYLDRDAVQELVHSDRLRMGHFEDHCLLVDPAALVRGLRDSALARGVEIYENTPVDELEAVKGTRVEARTPFGTVHADRGLIATNAYAHSIPSIRRFLFTIYAYVSMTSPLTEAQWGRLGWTDRFGIEDRRIMPHFHRPTADGRILWGGRDAPFVAVGPNPKYDRDPHIFKRLEETFRWTFPQLNDVQLEHFWAGPVGGTVSCLATVRWMEGERLLYALGYAGHGVGSAHLIGKVVRDEMLNEKSRYTDLPFTNRRPVPLPPGPLRKWILDTSQGVLLKADDTDGEYRHPLKNLAIRALQ